MNTLENNPIVPNDVKTTKQNNMNENLLDLNYILGDDAVDQPAEQQQTASVDPQTVDALSKAFNNNPSSVELKLHNVKEFLYVTVQITFNGNYKHIYSYQTYADIDLVQRLLASMANPKRKECLSSYIAEEHPLESSATDLRVVMFKQLLNSSFRCRFDKDFAPTKDESYVCATFQMSNRKEAKFCLKRTPELESIINGAMQA